MTYELLTPSAYNLAENNAKRKLPNRILEAFSPASFDKFGYPTRVELQEELFRWVEVMHEGLPVGLLHKMLGGLNEEEESLLKEVATMGRNLSLYYCKNAVVPYPSLLPALLALRHIQHLFPNRDSVILEIGPGDGYLGAMLILLGYGYISTDVTQAFYLYQNNLFSNAHGKNFTELALINQRLDQIGRIRPGTSLHIPWWKFANSRPEEINLDVDCVIGSGVFCEMHPNALSYLAHQSHRWLSSSNTHPKFLYMHGPGAEGVSTMSKVENSFRSAGFHLAHSDRLGATQEDLPHDIGFFWVPFPYSNDIAAEIIEARRKHISKCSLGFDPFLQFLNGLAEGGEIMTEDERFIRFCSSGQI